MLKENCRILRKIRFFSVFSHRPGAILFNDVVFAAMGYWKVPAPILVACRWFGLGCAGLRFVSRQEHLFPHCFGTFSISSLFYFVLSENNQRIISPWLQKNGKRSYFAAEIQASHWIAREFSAWTIQSTIRRLNLWQWEVVGLTHALLKTQNLSCSRLENRRSAKYV